MRFNVSVWHPRDRQKGRGKAFLEPRLITKRGGPITEHPDPRRDRVADIAGIMRIMREGQGCTIEPLDRINRDQKGPSDVRFGREKGELRREASRDATMKASGLVVAAVVDGKRKPWGLGAPELGILEEDRGRTEFVLAHLRKGGRSRYSSSRARRSWTERAMVNVA
jgi:hypothetical protein